MGAERLLQAGYGRRVVVEDGGRTVRKTFHDGSVQTRRALARSEFERLERFSAALADVPQAACPRPLELLEEPPGLRMERAAGRPLLEQLDRGPVGDRARHRLARVIASALVAYDASLGEPLPDFKLDNLLLDPATGVVTFVDLGLPQHPLAPPSGASSHEIALGDLVGATIFQSAQPRHVFDRPRHREAAALCAAVVREVAACDGAVVRAEPLRAAVRASYRRSAFGRGPAHTAWYAIAGPVLGVRVRTAHGTLGPAAGRS